MLSIEMARKAKLYEENLVMWFRKIQKSKWAPTALLILFCLTIAVISDRHRSENGGLVSATPHDGSLADINGLDTYIPNGFVLLPIEIQNLNALDAIIGRFGVVDLYVPGESQPVARAIKIVRSPKNNDQFSVLIPESQSGALIKASTQPFFAILQNPKKVSNEIRPLKHPSRVVIDN